MPGMAKPTILDEVHRSCKAAVAASHSVTISSEAVAALATQLDAAAVRAAGAKAGRAFPLKFDSLEAEVTFLALYHLLDFGSGCDDLLHAANKRGAAETMQFGCFGLALSAKRLDAPWMAAFSPYLVHSGFGIEAKVEQQLQPGITISKPGPLAPLAAAIQSCIAQAGSALQAVGQRSLGSLILEHLDSLKAAGKPLSAASLVEELTDTIPGFQDSALLVTPPAAAAAAADGGDDTAEAAADGAAGSGSIRVVFARKAQALAQDLQARFGPEDERFVWADGAQLSADSGAVLVAVLRRLGVIALSPQLAAALEQQQQQLAPGPDESALRAAAVAAADDIVAAAAATAGEGGAFTASQLSCYLLSQVEEDGPCMVFQGAPLLHHLTRETTAY